MRSPLRERVGAAVEISPSLETSVIEDFLGDAVAIGMRVEYGAAATRLFFDRIEHSEVAADLAVSVARDAYQAISDGLGRVDVSIVAGLFQVFGQQSPPPVARSQHDLMFPGADRSGVFVTAECARICREFRGAAHASNAATAGRGDRLLEIDPVAVSSDLLLYSAGRSELMPLIGRGREVAELDRCAAAALSGKAVNMLLTGSAGIGKTRLLTSFADHLNGADLNVIYHGANRVLGFRPLQSLVGLLSGLARTPAGATDLAIDKLLTFTTASGDPDHPDQLDALRSLFLQPVSNRWRSLDPAEQLQKQVDCLAQICARLSRDRALVCLLDDFHWYDALSQKIVVSLMGKIHSARHLFILAVREPIASFEDARFDATIALEELTRIDATVMVRVILGVHSEVRSVSEQIVEYAGGTPLYLEQLTSEMVESGKLKGTQGRYFPKSFDQSPDITPRIKHTISERIRRLPESAQMVLALASVIGDRIDRRHLEAILELPVAAIGRSLDLLSDAKFLTVDNQGHVSFGHALIHECAGDLIDDVVRRDLHRNCYFHFESLEGLSEAERIGRMEFHSRIAGMWPEAFAAARSACEKGVQASALDDSVAMMRHAISASSYLQQDREVVEQRLDTWLLAAGSLTALGQQKELVEALDQAGKEAAAIGDEYRENQVLALKVVAQWMTGRHTEALETAERALQLASKIKEPGLSFATAFNKGMVLHATGRFPECLQIMDKLARTLEGRSARRPFGWALYPGVFVGCFRVSSLGSLGKIEEGIEIGRQAVELADAVNHPFSQIMADQQYAASLMRASRFGDAVEVMERGWNLSLEFDARSMIPGSGARLISGLVPLGELERARSVLDKIVPERVYSQGGRQVWAWVFLAACEFYLARQRPERALEYALEALNLCRTTGEKAHEIHARVYYARCLRLMGNSGDEAAEQLRQSKKLAEGLGYVYMLDVLSREGNRSKEAAAIVMP